MSAYNKHRLIHELAEDECLNATQIAVRVNISAKTVNRHLKTARYSPPEAVTYFAPRIFCP